MGLLKIARSGRRCSSVVKYLPSIHKALDLQHHKKQTNKQKKQHFKAGRQWLVSVILAIQEAEIRRFLVESQPEQIVIRPYLENTHHKEGWCSGSRCRP
jgi:hypothetical protein